MAFVFGNVRINMNYANYLICGHGAWSSRTLPLGVILL